MSTTNPSPTPTEMRAIVTGVLMHAGITHAPTDEDLRLARIQFDEHGVYGVEDLLD